VFQPTPSGDRSHCHSFASDAVVDSRGRVMIFHRSTLVEPEDIEPESIVRMKKWTAVSCTVIVVVARIVWGFAR
jgi:hypothetical protein